MNPKEPPKSEKITVTKELLCKRCDVQWIHRVGIDEEVCWFCEQSDEVSSPRKLWTPPRVM